MTKGRTEREEQEIKKPCHGGKETHTHTEKGWLERCTVVNEYMGEGGGTNR